MELEKLKKRQQQISNRILEIQNEPKTRMSAYGGIMIHEARLIKEWENLDEELGSIRANIYSIEHPEKTSAIELVYCHNDYIVETYIENGIIAKGGLLESYFKGRLASEHHNYVINRHEKQYYSLIVNSVNIEPSTHYTKGVAKIDCKIGNIQYSGICNYNSRVDEVKYFYFNIFNIDIKRNNTNRGLSKREKQLLKYVCAMYYRDKFKPNCSINLTDN